MGLEKERALTMQEIKKHKGKLKNTKGRTLNHYIYIMLKQNEDNGGREIVKIWRTEREKREEVGFHLYSTAHL